MKAITAVGATPNRLAILLGVLEAAGPQGEARERLAALIGPQNLARTSNAGEENALSDCLAAAEELGLITREAGIARLSEEASSPRPFRALADAIMIDAPETAFATPGWMAGAAAWLLAQREPLPWGGSQALMRLREQMGGRGETFGMTNDSRWQQAVYWLRVLGCASRSGPPGDFVIPDPTPIVARWAAALLPIGEQRPMEAFRADLARSCQVLDGGRIRVEVEVACGIERASNALSPSLALALARLRHRGVLEFRSLADAAATHGDGLPNGRATHVVRTGA